MHHYVLQSYSKCESKKQAFPNHQWLVGGFKPSEKYEFVNWDDDSKYMGKSSSHVPGKPPTSSYIIVISHKIPSNPIKPPFFLWFSYGFPMVSSICLVVNIFLSSSAPETSDPRHTVWHFTSLQSSPLHSTCGHTTAPGDDCDGGSW